MAPGCEKKLPEHLYHYTSIHGLHGILTSRFLWASEIHFLNDTQEFKYSFRILEKLFKDIRKNFPSKLCIPTSGLLLDVSKPPRQITLKE